MTAAEAIGRYDAAGATIERVVARLHAHLEEAGDLVEGNAFYRHHTLVRFDDLLAKRRNLFWAASRAPARILEIGFNAGHSALIFLAASPPQCELVCFDLGYHPYVQPCFEILRDEMPGRRLSLVLGDSRSTLPRWMAEHPDAPFSFDLAHVDGGHDASCVGSDVAHACTLVRRGGLIVLDDADYPDIRAAGERLCASGVCRIAPGQLPTTGYPHLVLEKTI